MSSPRHDPLARARAWTACVALVAAAAATPSEQTDGNAEFVRLLASVAPDASEADLVHRSEELARVEDAAAGYLDVLRDGLLPGPNGIPLPLTPDQHRVLELAGQRLPHGEVVRTIEARAQELDEEGRRTALEVLRWHATPRDIDLLVQLATGEVGATGEPTELGVLGPLHDAFLAALLELARGDLRAMMLAADMAEGSPARPFLVRAVGMSMDPVALPWLVRQLEEPEIGAVALQEIGRLAPEVSLDAAAPAARSVRKLLASPEQSSRRHAMRTLAALRDQEAIPALIRVLETGPGSERGSALAALRALTGLGLPAEPRMWRSWHEEELRWLSEEAADTLERLDSDREADVIAAVREISARSLYRDHLSRRLAGLLRSHEAPGVRRQVCLALSRLDSRAAVDDLVSALDDHDGGVREVAVRALSSITGLSLPPDREAWRSALLAGG